MKVGIESLAVHVPHYYLDLKTLAEVRGVDPGKFYQGLGQEKMAVPPPDEDIVSMAANAAYRALEGIDASSVDTVLLATESGIDQSKSAAVYVHHLLGLPANCKAVELKQACSSGAVGLLMALAYVAVHPSRKVLLVTSDIARYRMKSSGEPTQGAGAAALVVSAEPRIVELGQESGSYTEDVMDFWRPNYMDEALVDGKYSIKVYQRALLRAWEAYASLTHRSLDDHHRFCYHLPFTRMAEKAHLHLVHAFAGGKTRGATTDALAKIRSSLHYNRLVGNSYTASVFVALSSLLDLESDLEGRRVGLFSYGSGCVATFFSGVVLPGYRNFVQAERHAALLREREEITFQRYEEFYNYRLPRDGSECATPRHQTGLFRLAGITGHKRIYERVAAEPAEDRQGTPERKGAVASIS